MAIERFEIDTDIAKASTLPGWFYRSEDVYAACVARVFEPSWQIVADRNSVRIPGQVFPTTILDGCVDEPIVVTRDLDDRVHVLSNVCTHRAGLVCESPGIERFLRCRYHGRRFGLDGAFQHMPEFEQAIGFPAPSDSLPRLDASWVGPILFASIRASCGFDTFFGPVNTRLGWFPFDECVFEPSRSREYLVRANWALYCDNYLEGFHIPFVHAALNDTLDYGSYTTETFEWGVLQRGVAKSGEPAFDPRPSGPDAGVRVAAYYYWLFPNTMLNVYPWGVSVNIVRPLGVSTTRVSYLTYVLDPSKLDTGAGSALDRVEREDEAIVEAVQRGVRSRLYTRGRYSPTREQGVHHFHRLLAASLH